MNFQNWLKIDFGEFLDRSPFTKHSCSFILVLQLDVSNYSSRLSSFVRTVLERLEWAEANLIDQSVYG